MQTNEKIKPLRPLNSNFIHHDEIQKKLFNIQTDLVDMFNISRVTIRITKLMIGSVYTNYELKKMRMGIGCGSRQLRRC